MINALKPDYFCLTIVSDESEGQKKSGVVFRRCLYKNHSLKFYKIHRQTPVPESLF